MGNESNDTARVTEALLKFDEAQLKYHQQGLEEMHRTVRWVSGIAIGGIVLYQLLMHRPWLPQDLAERLQQRLQASGPVQQEHRLNDVQACGVALQRLAEVMRQPGPPATGDLAARSEWLAIVRDRCTPTFE